MRNYFCIYLMHFSTNKRKNGTFSAPSLDAAPSALAAICISVQINTFFERKDAKAQRIFTSHFLLFISSVPLRSICFQFTSVVCKNHPEGCRQR